MKRGLARRRQITRQSCRESCRTAHILDSDDFLSRKGGQVARHFDQQAFQPAAAILKIAAHYSRDELNAALAAARRALLYSLEQAGADIHEGRALFEALDVAVAISQYRA
jgi:hypothetical protein